MELGLKGKAALVTGGAGAIGGQIARRLSEEGCLVALADIAPSGPSQLPPSSVPV